MRRSLRSGPVPGRLPGRGGRAGLRGRGRGRRHRRCRGHDLLREHARRHVRARLPGGAAHVVSAGDGGTYDIGLQALSGALERGHRFLFVCYDNEAYMNTGVQRSGATPFAANTTTSPAGLESFGKAQRRKDMTAIAIAHHVPYVAQAAAVHWHDLSRKVERAVDAEGPAFLNVLTDCPLGWGHEPRLSARVLNAAVNTLFWPLYEVVDGRYHLTYRPEHPEPIENWLSLQTRFAHLLADDKRQLVQEIQRQVDADWNDLLARCDVAGDNPLRKE